MSEIETIRQRVEKATEGPWEFGVIPEWEPYQIVSASVGDDWLEYGFTSRRRIIDSSEANDADAEFIARARTDVPRLLELLDEAVGLLRDVALGWPTEVVRARAFVARLDGENQPDAEDDQWLGDDER